MAAASRLLAFLERLSDGDYEGEKEGTTEGELPAKVLAQYWKDNHKKHKLMCSQLYVRNFLLSSLEKLDPAIGKEELTKQEIRKEINEVKQNWKSLKLNYLQKVEEIQAAIPEFLYKIQLLEKGRETLCKSLQKLQAKKEELKEKQLKEWERCVELRRAELDRKISEVTDCIQKCEAEIHQQKEELQSYSGYAEMWATVTNRGLEQQKLQEALQGLKVLSLVEDELTLELNPQHIISTTRLKPLILSLLWTPQDSTIIRTNCEIFPVEEILSSQPVTDLPSTILRIYNCYLSQSELLAEIQQLQHRFAIDWLHTERKLLFLKGNTVCTFIIGHGYPNSGGIQLLSIQPKHGSIDYTNIKPSQGNPSLQDWLDYLSSSPEF
ncbi:ZW10 interactor [Latimeria chalumnae]|uniref:ZW10 interactor n=1 Tax=Latimeria chalumnae TaxID=7897 RepID=UPI00313CEC7C